MTMRRWAPWLALGVLVVGALAWAAWPSSGARTAKERAQDLASELRCPDCQSQSVADSHTPTAEAARRDIAHRIADHQSDAHIRQAYIDRYGESILLEPRGRGLDVLVWALPVVAVVLGGAGLVVALRRWHRQPIMTASAADEELVGAARHGESP